MIEVDPLQIWKGFHWSFLVNIQGLIVCLQRFEVNMALGNTAQAQIELETATDMMLASGAAMELAGSFSRQEYQDRVRKTMMPPQVQSKNFSGLMSWEHAWLIELWKRLRPVFEILPTDIQPQHDKFIAAYFELMEAHKAVCQKFGGGEGGSLRCEQSKAVDTLDKFGQNRWQLIDPHHRKVEHCPFLNHKSPLN
jgi:hypothetical protein